MGIGAIVLLGTDFSLVDDQLLDAQRAGSVRRGGQIQHRRRTPAELFRGIFGNMAKVGRRGKGKSGAGSQTFQPFFPEFSGVHRCFLLSKGGGGGILPRFT